ncbi:peritrophin-48-like [Procambarus clarkii]|uniref:peritrophin-48-like n=1 Tax=Procambarus clarkii TaxID=6728 RepID=UPI0037435E83
MIKYSLLIIALAVVSTAWMVQKDACEPDCSGKKQLDQVPDPLNCTNYYICLADNIPSDHSVPCLNGQHFDPVDPKCKNGTACTPTCVPPDCPITCNGSFSLISDPFDCGTYYICVSGQVSNALHCNPDTYFNGENCVSNKEVCCTVSCDPYCHPGIVQTPDPTDCTKYYICTQTGPVNPSFHFTCGSEQYFDYRIGRCAAGTSCTNFCSEGSSTTTTSTTTTSTTTTSTTTTPNSAVTTTTPRTVPPSTDCVDSLTCTATGAFPKCSSCQQEYFMCSAAGAAGVVQTCMGNYVFNTDPGYPYCILPTNCPYNP